MSTIDGKPASEFFTDAAQRQKESNHFAKYDPAEKAKAEAAKPAPAHRAPIAGKEFETNGGHEGTLNLEETNHLANTRKRMFAESSAAVAKIREKNNLAAREKSLADQRAVRLKKRDSRRSKKAMPTGVRLTNPPPPVVVKPSAGKTYRAAPNPAPQPQRQPAAPPPEGPREGIDAKYGPLEGARRAASSVLGVVNSVVGVNPKKLTNPRGFRKA
jgi:hypothetical protein